MRQKDFICKNCNRNVSINASGTKNRNHCPFCLYSLHIDTDIGDRKSKCGGLMRPIAKINKDDGEEVLVHKCDKCNLIRKNRIAGDDSFKLVRELNVMSSSDLPAR